MLGMSGCKFLSMNWLREVDIITVVKKNQRLMK